MWLCSWLRNGNRSSAGKQQRARQSSTKPASFRPQLEILEARDLPSFGAPTAYAVGSNPQAVVTADLNGDGKLDLVTANQGTFSSTTGTYTGGGVSVLLGLATKQGAPTGTFAAAQNYATGPAVSVAVGDLNGDGRPDIVTGNSDGTIRILLGKGDGTFQQGPTTAAGGGSYIAVADVNGDGKLDLISSYGGTSVWLGNGDGSFRAGPAYGSAGTAVAVGDFNGDGKRDIVVEGSAAGDDFTLNLLVGNGDGTFASPQTIFAQPSQPLYGTDSLAAITAADFNGDGKLDLAFATFVNNNTDPFLFGTVMLGKGDGTFPVPVGGYGGFNLSGGLTHLIGLATGDFNHDGKLDLITIGTASTVSTGVVGWWQGDGSGAFGTMQQLTTTTNFPAAFAVGDFNGDGSTDLAFVGSYLNGSDPSVEVLPWSTVTKKK